MTRSIYQFDAPAPPSAGVDAVAQVPGERSRIGVVRNPHSRHNIERPSSATPESGIKLALPDGRAAMAPALAELARGGLDLLVIDGGDGTVRDVLTLGQSVFGDRWPVLAVLPKGKTNALTLDLGVPREWRLPAALAAYDRGRQVLRRPLRVTALDRPDLPPVVGFILGAGSFTHAIRRAQDAHSLGLFNNLAVAATSVWGLTQALLASDRNIWRKGSPMALTLGPEAVPAPRSRHGDPAYRSIMLATTLEHLPMDVKPFGPPRGGLKLGVMDIPLRRILMQFPNILRGRLAPWLADEGYGVHDVASFDMTIGDSFIIDGEPFPAGRYRIEQGPQLRFVVP